MEQEVLKNGVNIYREIGPYGTILVLLCIYFLKERNLLGKSPHQKSVDDRVNDIKVKLEKKVEYEWIENHIVPDLKEKMKTIEKKFENSHKDLEDESKAQLLMVKQAIDNLSKEIERVGRSFEKAIQGSIENPESGFVNQMYMFRTKLENIEKIVKEKKCD